MRHKRFKLIAVLLFGVGMAGLNAQTMSIWKNDGIKTAYTLLDIKKVDFTSGHIKVVTIDGYYYYVLSDLSSLKFTEVMTVGQIQRPIHTTGSINLFPNPVVDVMNIQLNSTVKSIEVFEIISMEGRIVFSESLVQNGDVYQVNISDLAKGIYVCKLSNGVDVETIRFVKQ